jgi:hypothetical protein
MIQSINTYTNQWLMVNQSANRPYFNSGAQSAGMVRYNTSNACLEVYDGSGWFTFSGHAEINLTPEAQKIMEWGKEKLREEEELKQLMQSCPGIQDLKEKLDIMVALVREQEKQKP